MSDAGFWRLSATELLDGYRRRDFSPVEVTREVFDRIAALNPKLNAFLALNTDDAMEAARTAEAAWLGSGERGMLCGVPISLKDSIEMAGHPTTYGSKAFVDNRQPDSEIARRIRREGGVLIGKTNLPEFALHGAVDNRISPAGRNPWNLDHTCGGSSGGAGLAGCGGVGPARHRHGLRRIGAHARGTQRHLRHQAHVSAYAVGADVARGARPLPQWPHDANGSRQRIDPTGAGGGTTLATRNRTLRRWPTTSRSPRQTRAGCASR